MIGSSLHKHEPLIWFFSLWLLAQSTEKEWRSSQAMYVACPSGSIEKYQIKGPRGYCTQHREVTGADAELPHTVHPPQITTIVEAINKDLEQYIFLHLILNYFWLVYIGPFDLRNNTANFLIAFNIYLANSRQPFGFWGIYVGFNASFSSTD
jgi:hypothetical protein